jgi:hypothetical protein
VKWEQPMLIKTTTLLEVVEKDVAVFVILLCFAFAGLTTALDLISLLR